VERIPLQRSNTARRWPDSSGMGLGCIACWMLVQEPRSPEAQKPSCSLAVLSRLCFCPCPRAATMDSVETEPDDSRT
jgi:hypothetical protein